MGDTIDISQLKLSLRSFYNLLSGDVSETEEEQINEMLRKAATERTQQFGLTELVKSFQTASRGF